MREFFPSSGEGGYPWCQKNVKLREKWSSTCVKNHCTAGMVSTQLVESCNATVRGFLSHGMSLIDFFPHYERMLRSRRETEKLEEFKARNTQSYVAFEYSDVVNKAAVAKVGYASNVATLLCSNGEEDEERYILLYAKFGRIVRVVYSEEALYKYIDVVTDNIIEMVDLGMDALAALFGQGMVLTVSDNNLLLCGAGDSNSGRGMAPPSATPTVPKDIARKLLSRPNQARIHSCTRPAPKYIGGEQARNGNNQTPVTPPAQQQQPPSPHKRAWQTYFLVLTPLLLFTTFANNSLEQSIRRMKAENKILEARLKHINLDEIEYNYTTSSSL
ncbi:hypothetical protein LINGRAHAP2_LOCUS20070 [Linum grandiflorum]